VVASDERGGVKRRGFLAFLGAVPALAAASQLPVRSVLSPVPLYTWTPQEWEVFGRFDIDAFEVFMWGVNAEGRRCLSREIVTHEELENISYYPNTCECFGRFHSTACSDVNPIFWRDFKRIPVYPSARDYAAQIALNRMRKKVRKMT
jgi:hypothetical protein